MDWYDKLNPELKDSIITDWEVLLDQNLPERYYQKFLIENAGLFLGNEDCHLIISQLKLGSELETDFVTLTDNFSNGNRFELIEIKRPDSNLFNQNGSISSDFNKAIQQIRDWKRYLIDNKHWFKKYLPTLTTRVISNSHIKFKIIIGRRLTNPYSTEKRNQIADEIGAEIRSFDYLTDKFRSRTFYPVASVSGENEIYEWVMANPFYKAMSDSDWKDFCNSGNIATFHFSLGMRKKY